MAKDYRLFSSGILLKEMFSDDLGHLYRAAIVENETVDRTAWLRVLDAPDLPREELAAAVDVAREIGKSLKGAQLPSRPFFLVDGGVVAIGWDYEAGQPLNRTLDRAHDEAFPFQADNALLIAEKIAQALATAEAVTIAGVPLTHGYLHPGLVLLSNDGEVSVTGFGLGAALVGGLRGTGTGGGRSYLAPEVLAGGPPSSRADVYSVGAMLYQLLTGEALPEAPKERDAAVQSARTAWDGESVPGDIKSILDRALAASPDARFASAATLRSELDELVFGGAYSPTTFNLALSMDRLFRSEVEADELALEEEKNVDPALVLASATTAPDEVPELVESAPTASVPAADEPAASPAKKPWVLIAAVGVVIIAIAAAAIFWLGGAGGPATPPPNPTPTAEEIAAQREAQDARLRNLTQEMVQSMMAEREAEIRAELTDRQSRIEELQRRLQQSETRAARSAAAAAEEAATQRALMDQIQQAEEAQRAQQTALENDRQQAQERTNEDVTAAEPAATIEADGETTPSPVGTQPEDAVEPSQVQQAVAAPTATPEAREAAAPDAGEPSLQPGDYVAPEEIDTRPVIIKRPPLEWPRTAPRSKSKGVVVAQLTVNARGEVEDVTILRADHSGWGIPEAAKEAAAGCRFKPGTKDGVPVTTHAFVTWRYDFTGGS